jgi:hypothetical protein
MKSRAGGTISRRTVASKQYSRLSPGYSHPNADTGALTTTKPPAGAYRITVMLLEQGSDGVRHDCSIDTFSTRYTFGGTSSAPSITSFTANPLPVVPVQQTVLSWTSAGGVSASIDHGVSSVLPSGSNAVTPVLGVAKSSGGSFLIAPGQSSDPPAR